MIYRLLLILLPLGVYLVSLFINRRSEGYDENPDLYFAAFRQFDKSTFSNSSVAYSLQIATLYPFIGLVIAGMGDIAFYNTIFWLLGCLLFFFLLPKLRDFVFSSNASTLHHFLYISYGNNINIRVISAWATIVGLGGVAIGELVGASKLVAFYFGWDPSGWSYLLIMGTLAFIVLFYVYEKGQYSAIITDQFQLLFTYIGIIGLALFLLIQLTTLSGNLSVMLLIVVVGSLVILVVHRFKFHNYSSNNKAIELVGIIVNVLATLIFLALIIFSAFKMTALDMNFRSNIVVPRSVNTLAFISICILPIVFQFVDMTNWQRLISMRIDGNDKPNPGSQGDFKAVRTGWLYFSIESSTTWFILILIGVLLIGIDYSSILADTGIQEPADAIPRILEYKFGSTGAIFGALFVVSVLAIMLSTFDSILMASMFAFVYDIHPKSRAIIESEDASKNEKTAAIVRGKAFGWWYVLVIVIIQAMMSRYVNSSALFIQLLFGAFGGMTALAPAAIGALVFKRRPRAQFVIASIVSGFMASIITVLFSTIPYVSEAIPDIGWYPVVIGLFISTLIYIIGLMFVSDEKPNDHMSYGDENG